MGGIQEERLDDLQGAAATYLQATKIMDDPNRARVALARVQEGLEDWDGLAKTLDASVQGNIDENSVGLLVRLAELQTERLDAFDQARENFLRALEIDKINAQAVAGLEKLSQAGHVPRAYFPALAERLAPYYELTENYQRWAETLEMLVGPGSEGDPDTVSHLEMLADLYEGPLNDSARAFSASLRIFEREPKNRPNRDRLLGFAKEDNGRKATLAEAFGGKLEAEKLDPAVHHDLLVLVAELESVLPGRGAEAEAAYNQLLGMDPMHKGLFPP